MSADQASGDASVAAAAPADLVRLRWRAWAASAGQPAVYAVLAIAAVWWFGKPGHDGLHGMIMVAMVALAAVLSSIAGFAFSAICGAMLFHVNDDHVQVVQIMITCSIANQLAMTWATRRDIDWPQLSIFLAGGLLGLAPGIWVLLHADRHAYMVALGTLLTLYGLYMLFRRPLVVRRRLPAVDFLTGVLSGITGGAAGFPGAFVTIWCGMQGWSKARQRAVFQPFILLMQVAALLAIGLLHHSAASPAGFDLAALLFVPGSLLGTCFGMALYRRLSDNQFGRAVNALLIVSGLSFLL